MIELNKKFSDPAVLAESWVGGNVRNLVTLFLMFIK